MIHSPNLVKNDLSTSKIMSILFLLSAMFISLLLKDVDFLHM
jgi:hypothetical protein